MRLERVGEILGTVRRICGVISILRARCAVSPHIVCLLVRSADRKRNFVRIRCNDVRIRARSGGRPRDLFRRAVHDGVVRAVIDLVRTTRDAELRGIDLAFLDVACAPERAASCRRRTDVARICAVRRIRHIRRLARKRIAVKHIAGGVDQAIVSRQPRRAVCQLDVLIGDVDVRAGMASLRIRSSFARHVLRRDVVVIELQIFRSHDARELQHIIRRLGINAGLHSRRAVVDLAVVLRSI